MGSLPQIDFATFLVSLGTSAQMHLGLFPDPGTGKTHISLEHAQQTIDILALLQEKTKGNLSQPEQELLHNLLYELRVTFVEKKKSA